MRGFVLLGVHMKAIQFIKTDNYLTGNNSLDICTEFTAEIDFDQDWRIGGIAKLNGNNQQKLIRLGDWVLEIDGVIVVLNNEDYQLLQKKNELLEIEASIKSQLDSHKHKIKVGLLSA